MWIPHTGKNKIEIFFVNGEAEMHHWWVIQENPFLTHHLMYIQYISITLTIMDPERTIGWEEWYFKIIMSTIFKMCAVLFPKNAEFSQIIQLVANYHIQSMYLFQNQIRAEQNLKSLQFQNFLASISSSFVGRISAKSYWHCVFGNLNSKQFIDQKNT